MIPHPITLLAGGGWRARKGPDPLLPPVFARAGRSAPTIAYVGAASGDDREFFALLSRYFQAAGAGAVRLAPTVSPHADMQSTRAILEEADLIFITGGDVEEGLRVLHARGLIGDLARRYRHGTPFFGLSAGSIMLARQWIRWRDPADDATAEPFDCLGFAPVLCDTHAEAEDWEELRALLRLKGEGAEGYGIPTNGALLVTPQGTVTALGHPAVHLRFVSGRIHRLKDLPA